MYIYTYIDMHISMYKYIYAYMYICMYTYINIYLYMYIYKFYSHLFKTGSGDLRQVAQHKIKNLVFQPFLRL